MILRVHNVRKSFGEAGHEVSILNGVSLEIDHPETVAIMGRSGCGKSTLISLLAGLETPDSGEIKVLDQDILALSPAELNSFRAHNVAVIFQQFHLLDHLTALENVRLPLDLNEISDSDLTAQSLLKKVGLEYRLNHFPDQLSRGECQRVAIARALAMKPKVLLADEPTGSLDVKTGKEVTDLIMQLAESEKIALLMATHDPEIAKRCQRRLYMNEGFLASAPTSQIETV
jgi:putative ABC transport system ATP-binding protein